MLFQAKEKKNQNLKIDQNNKKVEEWLQKAYLFFFNFKKQAKNSFFRDILAKNHLHIWAKNIKRTSILSSY